MYEPYLVSSLKDICFKLEYEARKRYGSVKWSIAQPFPSSNFAQLQWVENAEGNEAPFVYPIYFLSLIRNEFVYRSGKIISPVEPVVKNKYAEQMVLLVPVKKIFAENYDNDFYLVRATTKAILQVLMDPPESFWQEEVPETEGPEGNKQTEPNDTSFEEGNK